MDKDQSETKVYSIPEAEKGGQNPDKTDADSSTALTDPEAGKASCCLPETRIWAIILKLMAVAVAGILFGLALEKGRVFEPSVIRGQMILKRWIMLKIFLAAMGSGQLVLAIVALIPQCRKVFDKGYEAYKCAFASGDKGLLTTILGTFVLGMGMTLSGACPGMVLAQVGSWTKNAYLTLIGALFAALLYGLIAKYAIRFTKPKSAYTILAIHEKFNFSFSAVAIPSGLLVMLTVVLMEIFIPWKDDLDFQDLNTNITTSNIFALKSWPPYACGILIGILQLVILFSVSDTLGGSSAYMTLVSQWVIGNKLKETFPHLANFRCGIGNWWQVFYVIFAMVGALISSVWSNSFASTKGVSEPSAVCGGILLLLGARIAAGCTSGHGLSGASLLFWFSWIAIPSMFAGGIVTAFAMDATGALDHYVCYTGTCTDTVGH